ncbi:hypothetical protein PORCRE_2054 [Porphyromonas crevioricanis JCM 15906]|uniref:Uncharacterized protein n=1 Tax=Porphyromonas crevioricanis JCM 15906 TaxID=1305617 RepID=T1CJ81_9PORP|nr:hypothetical protein PORCRE_2054 [Porphyromonas crevioricanis JCM 15906]GAD06706.1 hypothetical protein PORCAN_305 [Porphyromonas crevioricanis JCM 13913]
MIAEWQMQELKQCPDNHNRSSPAVEKVEYTPTLSTSQKELQSISVSSIFLSHDGRVLLFVYLKATVVRTHLKPI